MIVKQGDFSYLKSHMEKYGVVCSAGYGLIRVKVVHAEKGKYARLTIPEAYIFNRLLYVWMAIPQDLNPYTARCFTLFLNKITYNRSLKGFEKNSISTNAL